MTLQAVSLRRPAGDLTMRQYVKRSLIAYWPLDESVAGSNAASALYDYRGPYDATPTNTLASAVGPSSDLPLARQFTRATPTFFTRTAQAGLPTQNNDYTAAGWCYLDSQPAAGLMCIISRRSATVGAMGWSLQYQQATDRFVLRTYRVDDTQSNINANNFGGTTTATWYFVAGGMINARIGWISVNAGARNVVFDFGSSAPSDCSADDLCIGNTQPGSLAWDGRIAAPMVWNRAVSDLELRFLYNNGRGRDLRRTA